MSDEGKLPCVNRRLIFLGPPGAGKGTQAVRVAEAFGLAHISTGEMFRQAVRRGGELGKLVKRYMDEGKLVPDDTVVELVKRSVDALGDDPGFVLDGVPRTLTQAERLAEFFNDRGIPVQAAVLFDLEEDVVLERLSGRRQCPVCGRIYNIYSNPPQRRGRCDVDGSPLVQRPDDRPEVVRQRIRVYRAEIAPVVEFYRQAGLLYRVDASRPADKVFNDLSHILACQATPEA